MYKEIAICILIVILVLVLNTITQKYTKEAVETINCKLEDFKYMLQEDNNINVENLKENNKEIMDIWKDKYEILAYYIEHDELEKVETELTSLSSFVEVEEYDDGIENIDRCIFILNHIKNKYTMEIKNVF